jgi:hypothetical protein
MVDATDFPLLKTRLGPKVMPTYQRSNRSARSHHNLAGAPVVAASNGRPRTYDRRYSQRMRAVGDLQNPYTWYSQLDRFRIVSIGGVRCLFREFFVVADQSSPEQGSPP